MPTSTCIQSPVIIVMNPALQQQTLLQSKLQVFYLTTHSTHLVTVIWRQTYGKGPFK